MRASLLAAVDPLAGDDDLDRVLTRIVAAAASATGADNGALGMREGGSGALRFLTVGPDDVPSAGLGGRSGTHSLVVPVQVREKTLGLICLTGRSPDPTFTESDETLVRVLADAAGRVVEHAHADERAERRRRWLEAAADLSESLSIGLPIERAFDQVARRARAASGARAAAVVAAPRGSRPVVTAYDGPAALASSGALERAVADAWGPEPADGDPWILVTRLRARLGDRTALVLVLPRDRDAADELDLLAQFADQAGLAIDRAQAVAVHEELAVLAERERIARELHDVVVQRLFAAGLQLQSLRETPDLVDEGLDAVVDLLDTVIREIRGTVLDLREDRVSPRRAASPR